MGLFSKQVCVRCGNKAGLLTREKLATGDYLCSDCAALCSPELTSNDFHTMTPDDVEAHIQAVEENAERYQNEFSTTTTIRSTMVLSGKDVLYADDNHGWWVNATVSNPDIFTFEQAGSCRVELETSTLDDDDKKNTFFNAQSALAMQYPGLPMCPPGKQIEKMTFVVSIMNHPPITEVHIPIMDAIIPSEGDIRGGYDCAWQLMNFFKEKQQTRNATIQQATMAAAVAQAAAAAAAATQTAQAQAQPAQGAGAGDVADQLMKLKQLVDAGILTQEEFDAKKKQILGL